MLVAGVVIVGGYLTLKIRELERGTQVINNNADVKEKKEEAPFTLKLQSVTASDLEGLWRVETMIQYNNTFGKMPTEKVMTNPEGTVAFQGSMACGIVKYYSSKPYCDEQYVPYIIEGNKVIATKPGTTPTVMVYKNKKLEVSVVGSNFTLILERISKEAPLEYANKSGQNILPTNPSKPVTKTITTPIFSYVAVPESPTLPDYSVDITQNTFGVLSSNPATSSPHQPFSGDDVAFGALINDFGAKTTVSSIVRLRLDVGNNGTWNQIENETIGPMNSESPRFSTVWFGAKGGVWKAVSGTHKFEICADATNVVVESMESNNCITQLFTVK